MVYAKSLHAVTQNELQAVGYRAQDIAFLQQNQLLVPSSFVVLSNAFDEVIRLNNLKYKIDYVMSHAQPQIHSSLQNVYSSARKAIQEAKLPPGFEVEMREFYESITTPLAVGELVTERLPARIIMSTNVLDDPENNDTIIQNVNSFDELLLGLREAWALAYHPSLLGPRLREHFPENRLRVALLIQAMDEPATTIHAYSSLQQDHAKVYLQVYYGYPDLRDRVLKDYYAIGKQSMRVAASQVRQQPSQLARPNKELELLPIAPTPGDKIVDRDIAELARLSKKIERLLQVPVKAFFVSAHDSLELLWVNRLGFDVIVSDEAAPQPAPPAELITVDVADDFIAPVPSAKAEVAGVAAKLLAASLKIVHQIVERKYRSAFGETDMTGNISDMVNRLNGASTFSRPVDGALLLQAEEAARNESNISESEYAKAIEEVAYLMTYA